MAEGATAVLSDCGVSCSKETHGVPVSGAASSLTADQCRVHDNQRAGVLVFGGASAALTGCNIWGSKESFGLDVHNVGSSLTADT